MLDGPFRGSEATARGLITWSRLRGPGFRRLFPDVYVPAGTPSVAEDLELRSRAAYLLVRDSGGVLAGYSAAMLLGADCAPRTAPAEVLVPGGFRRHPGLAVRWGAAAEPDVEEVAGCRLTSPMRTAWDLARREPLVGAVVAVDALARAGGFPPDALLARSAACPGTRGCRRLPRIVGLADPRAESPGETRLRLLLVRGGLPAPEVQYWIHDEYGFELARADLAYPEARLAIEYDGAVHYTRRQGERDRRRDNLLADHRWETLRVGRDEVTAADTVRRVRDILAARAPGRAHRGQPCAPRKAS
jgi:hypothetical protein